MIDVKGTCLCFYQLLCTHILFTNNANNNNVLFSRSVQMRLYSMHKREFVMVFAAFFACFGLAIFIGLAGK